MLSDQNVILDSHSIVTLKVNSHVDSDILKIIQGQYTYILSHPEHDMDKSTANFLCSLKSIKYAFTDKVQCALQFGTEDFRGNWNRSLEYRFWKVQIFS